MAHAAATSASQETEASTGYVLLPRQLRQDCRHVGINTLKLVLTIADATLGWNLSRWSTFTYRAIVAEAGIPTDAGVRRALEEALAASLIEVQTTASGTLYAIHRRYWLAARVQPKWHLYKRVPYDPQTDPLEEHPPAITTIAQPVKTDVSTPDAAITMIANNYHHDSGSLSSGKQAAITTIAEPLSEDTPSLASHAAKERRKEEAEALSELPGAQDVDAALQRQADQHILQQLLAEQEHLRQAKPSMPGWGEAQRRLRFLAREIPRIQARATSLAVAPDSAVPATVFDQAEPAEERRSARPARPIQLPRNQAATAEVSPALDPRRERLMQLQRELAQLKRTPSMQLLARQRIPKLEAAIKQLIIELQESA